ncbi:serine/threonine-protein kinase RIO3 isoform X1 [Euwallacea similis]|uniref:serine/threonine-protein kinase RIO3 isoform X1 n=2 Tax=Euwallacea similis TaxID=1736056 RepID=UPI00344E91AE
MIPRMSCPWANIKQPESMNLADIMSEELARDLQAKAEAKAYENISDNKHEHVDVGKESEANARVTINSQEAVDRIPDEVLKAISNESMESDALIAQLLQLQFDKEYNESLKRSERKFNGSSKVSISFKNFKRLPEPYGFESDEEEEIEDIRDRKDWDRFDSLLRDLTSMPICGYKINENGELITKHDLVNNGRKNACKLLSFPPEFRTGDGEDFDLKLSNKVFNTLKAHSKKEQVRKHKLNDKKLDIAINEFGIDAQTRICLFKMIDSRFLEIIDGLISIGKEAVLLHAQTSSEYPYAKEPLPPECAIKVFRTILTDFKRRDKYIKDDHRFKDRIGNQTSKKVIHIWAEKEMVNLARLKKAGIPCPEVITLQKHVLVMTFIGKNNVRAPKLKEAHMSEAELVLAYDQVISAMKTLYTKANLIHADLSEYNILWYGDLCYFIDVSQSVEPSHENAFHFLHRDCCNIINFFTRMAVPNILTADDLFEYIVGCPFTDQITLLALQKTTKMKPHLMNRPGVESSFAFETAWEQSQQQSALHKRLKIKPDEDQCMD